MPKHVIISKLGGPEVLKYQEYNLPNEIKVNEIYACEHIKEDPERGKS